MQYKRKKNEKIYISILQENIQNTKEKKVEEQK